MSAPGGRGRARGRGSTDPKPGGAPAPARGGGGGPAPPRAGGPGPSAAPPASAWPRPGQARPAAPAPAPAAQPPRPQPTVGITQAVAAMKIGGNGNGNGNGNGSGNGGNGSNGGNGKSGRGGIRGRRAIEFDQFYHTKPTTCVTKNGSFGRKVELITNYFSVLTMPNWVIFQYRVDFSEEIDLVKVKKAWLRQHKEKIGTAYLFEGTMLFSSQQLTHGGEPMTLTSTKLDGSPVLITIKLVSQLQEGDYQFIQIYNLVIRQAMGCLDLNLVGRNLFDAKAATNIPEFKLTVWPGYITSIRQHENNVLLCTDLASRVMRNDTAYDIISNIHRNGGDVQGNATAALIGQIVLTDYNNRTYKVNDIDFKMNPLSKFSTKNGDVTYVDYYLQKYQIKIRDVNQPMLISRPKERDIRGGIQQDLYLVPELVKMTGLSDDMRNNFQLMKALAGVTHVSPRDRVQKLNRFNQRLHSNPDIQKIFKGWDMTLSKDLVRVPGRQYDPETMVFGNNQRESAGAGADWTRTSQSKAMLVSAPLNDWVVVVPKRDCQETEKFIRTMISVAGKMNFRMPFPAIYEIQQDRMNNYLEAINSILSQSNPCLIYFVLSNNSPDRYNAIKRRCYVERAVSSQVMVRRNLSKNAMTIATKIAIQINCKLGGAPWCIDLPKMTVMIVGYDACHDTNNKALSYGATVATSNPAMTSWYSCVNHHSNGEELSQHFAADIGKCLRRWLQVNKSLPDRVIVYRDGVGDGQLQHVASQEVEAVKETLNKAYNGPSCKLTYIIVTKRLNTKIMTTDHNNPMPGTVVDDVITLPEKYDFFLISQSARQGTVSPTGYNIISDNSNWGPDHLQRLSHKLCHLYYNFSATVRVPAPCQYAHKLAFLAAQNLHEKPSESLSDRLYFI